MIQRHYQIDNRMGDVFGLYYMGELGAYYWNSLRGFVGGFLRHVFHLRPDGTCKEVRKSNYTVVPKSWLPHAYRIGGHRVRTDANNELGVTGFWSLTTSSRIWASSLRMSKGGFVVSTTPASERIVPAAGPVHLCLSKPRSPCLVVAEEYTSYRWRSVDLLYRAGEPILTGLDHAEQAIFFANDPGSPIGAFCRLWIYNRDGSLRHTVMFDTIQNHRQAHVTDFEFSPDNRRMAVAVQLVPLFDSSRLMIFDGDTFQLLNEYEIPCRYVSFAPDGLTLACFGRKDDSPFQQPDLLTILDMED